MTAPAVPTVLLEALAAVAAQVVAEGAAGAPIAPTLEHELATVLDRGGHRAALVAHVSAIPRRNSGWYRLPGYHIKPTTVRGQAAVYIGYQGEASKRLAQLQAYSATLAGAGYPVQPVWLRADRTRATWPWNRSDPPSGVRALLVTPAAPFTFGDPGERVVPHLSQGESPRP